MIVPQSIITRSPCDRCSLERRLKWWMSRATSSLPVPLSPISTTGALEKYAASMIRLINVIHAGLKPRRIERGFSLGVWQRCGDGAAKNRIFGIFGCSQRNFFGPHNTPTVPRHTVRQSALKHLVHTFFDGSREKVVSALLGSESGSVSDEELERIAQIIDKARKERR
jgi:hypothetical protein